MNNIFMLIAIVLLVLFYFENDEDKRNDYNFSFVITIIATAIVEIFTLIFR